MKNTSSSLPELLKDYQSLELRAHVSLDDVLSKVTQEVAELAEAYEAKDIAETRKEAADVIVNILSASSKFGALPGDFTPSAETKSPNSSELLQMLGKWNDTLQSFRGRFSRRSATVAELSDTTCTFVSSVLLHAGENRTIESIVQDNTAKFSGRVEAYKSDIVLEDYVRAYPDFPKKGILFRDISPMLASPEAMRYIAFEMAYSCRDADIIAGLDARGFLFGMQIADILGKPFAMIRKKGKLPGPTIGTDYSLEYGDNSIEMQKDAVQPGQKVAIIDDLLATGGTLAAAAELVEKAGGIVNNIACAIALDEEFLQEQIARKKLLEKYEIVSILHYS